MEPRSTVSENDQKEGVASDETTTTDEKNNLDFSTQNLHGANFTHAGLNNAIFHRAYLMKANFRRAQLQASDCLEADFLRANLLRANFWKACMQNAEFYEAELQGSFFIDADMRGAHFAKANFEGAMMQEADLRFARNLHAALLPKGWYEALQNAGLIPSKCGECTPFTERFGEHPDLIGRNVCVCDACLDNCSCSRCDPEAFSRR